MEKKQVFISYKSEEFDEALAVKTILEDNGISCWMAPMCITGGSSYASEIPAAINNCTVFVLILSKIVQTSRWVPRELDQAINANKLILPFMLEECELNDEFSFYLSNVQRYHAYIDREASIEKMLREIKSKLGIKEEKRVEKEPEEVSETQPEHQNQIEKPKPKAPTKNKPELKKKAPKEKTALQNKNKKLITLLCAALAIIILVSSVIAYSIAQKIEFAGNTYQKSDYSLEVTDAEITDEDMQALGEFNDLSYVAFKNCTIKAKSLEGLTEHSLSRLEIVNCNLTDSLLKTIDFKKLNTVYALDISDNKEIKDISFITPLAEKLTELNVSNTSVLSLNAIAGFTKLERLSIDDLGLINLTDLNKLVYLKYISADGNKLTTLDGLQNTTVLEEVSFCNNALTDVSLLSNSAATLRTVKLNNNALADLSALGKCTNIVKFYADGNQLLSTAFTYEMGNLSTLSLSNNKIDSLQQLTQSEKLSFLNVSGNELTVISDVVFSKESSVFADFSNNGIISLDIPKNCKYGFLALHGNNITEKEQLKGLQGYNITFDYFDVLDTQTLKDLDFTTIYLSGCPDNRIVEFESASYAVKLVDMKKSDEAVEEYLD